MQLLLLLYVLLYDVATPSVSHFLDVPHKCKYCQDILLTLLHKSFSIRWFLLECEPMQLLLLLYVLLYDVTTPSVSHFLDVPHKLSLIHSQNDIAKSFNDVECQSYGCERGLYLVHDCCPVEGYRRYNHK